MFNQSWSKSLRTFAPIRQPMTPFQKLLRLSLAQQLLLLRVGLLVILIRLSLAWMPFGKLHSFLTKLSNRISNPKSADDLQTILWATQWLGRHLLGDRPCLTEALTVQTLLRRRGYPAELRIGVIKGTTGQLQAHAWVESANKIVIGGAESPHAYKAFPKPIQSENQF